MAAEVVLYGTKYCGYCVLARRFLSSKHVSYQDIDVTDDYERRAWLMSATGRRTVPQIFIDGKPVGGYTDLVALDRAGKLDPMLAGA